MMKRDRRRRGVVLSSQGRRKLLQAIRALEIEQNIGEKYTLAELSEYTGLASRTLTKVVGADQGVDRRTLEIIFNIFHLDLELSEYCTYGEEIRVELVEHTSRLDWGQSVEPFGFTGRKRELAQLEQWIVQDDCRLLTISGMGGIGKSSLSVCLARSIQDQFSCVIWRSLRNAPTIEALLRDLLQFIYIKQETILPDDAATLTELLVEQLRQQRCLLILDNVETVLNVVGSGQYRSGYEGYGQVLRCIGETSHCSCLILTSREQVRELVRLDGEGAPVKHLRLAGLLLEEAKEILWTKGLTSLTKDQTRNLIELYTGNPLALKIVAATLRDLFGGDATAFFKDGTTVFGDIYDLLDQQFKRLSYLEQEVLYWLAINRELISIAELAGDTVPSVPQIKLMEALESLERRSLLECQTARFTLQPVVMEYVTICLIQRITEELVSGEPVLLRSHALLKAQGIDYIRDSQSHLIVQPLVERLLTRFPSKKALEEHLRLLLARLQGKSSQETGYSAGNILNILRALKTELNGLDLSRLAIRQAELRGIELQKVDLSNCNLIQTVFTETFSNVTTVAYGLDSHLLGTGDANGEVRIWQMPEGIQKVSFEGHTGWIWSVAFSPDGWTLASASIDRNVRLWDVESGRCRSILQGHSDPVWTVAFSPDGRSIYSGSQDGTICLWDVATGECQCTLAGHTGWVLSVAVSPDGRTLASGSSDNSIRLWDTATKQCRAVLVDHTNWVYSVTVSPDGQMLASSSSDNSVRLWKMSTGQCRAVLVGHTDIVWSVDFSPDGRTLASGSTDGSIRLWDVATGECHRSMTGQNDIWSVAFCPDGRTLASGDTNRTVRLWDIEGGECRKMLQGHASWMYAVTFDKRQLLATSDHMIASGSVDGTARLWDVSNGSSLGTLVHPAWVFSVVFLPEISSRGQRKLVSGCGDGLIRIWNLKTGECLKTLEGHAGWVWSIALHPDGQQIATASGDGTVRLWELESGNCLAILRGHSGWVSSVDFSPDGRTLISSGADGTIRVWDTASGQCRFILSEHASWVHAVSFSPDGSVFASAGEDSTAKLWDTETGCCLRTLHGHTDAIWSLDFDLDGHTLVTGSADRSVRVWDVRDGSCLHTLCGHTNWVISVALATDVDGTKIVASGSQDETIRLWNAETGTFLRTMRVTRPYEEMNITGISGLNEAQKTSLRALGAIEN
jgi:WD40 repeat protein